MKKIFSFCALALAATAAFAVPAKPGQWKTIRLSDGTEVRVELKGDEYGGYWQAADGRAFVENSETGAFTLADLKELQSKAAVLRAAGNAERVKRLPKANGMQGAVKASSYEGNKKGLIILVNFTDATVKFQSDHTKELFTEIANTENYSNPKLGFTGSISDYFRDQSLGKLNLKFDVVGPVQLSHQRAYYGADKSSIQRDRRAGEMAAEAMKLADEYVNYADYDWDGDGTVEQVFILYAGKGQHDGGPSAAIWPHESKLSASDYGKSIKLDNVKLDTYACSSELQGSGGICGIGTICHEFSHCLGYPDLYDPMSSNFGMGTWDIMDVGSYIDNGFTPSCYTGLERMLAGWQYAKVLRNDTEIDNMKPISTGGDFYIVYNEGNKNEFYMLENHQNVGWDAKRTGTGLLVTHVDYDAGLWRSNSVNSTAGHPRCTIIAADGMLNDNYPEGNAYPYNGRNSLTDNTTPAATLYNANINGKKFMGKPITDIHVNSDGTVGFTFKRLVELSEKPDIWDDPTTGITDVSVDKAHAGSGRIYTVDGRYAGQDLKVLSNGLYIVNSKKILK